MKIEFIKEGKWILDMPNNKKWTNTCNKCYYYCEQEPNCNERCCDVFIPECGCYGCELEDLQLQN